MKRDRYLELPREEMNTLFEFYLRKLQRVDGFWFLGVEERFGTKEAAEINSEVWGKVGRRDAEAARNMLGVTGVGIPPLIEALKKTYMAFADWEIVQVSDTHAVFRVTTCYPQKARIEKGKTVYNCRSSEEAFFKGYCQGIDPRFTVRCGFCPLDKYFDDLWCEWHFFLG